MLHSFVRDEGHAVAFDWREALRSRLGKAAIVVILLNEMRGIAAANELWKTFGPWMVQVWG